MYYVLHASLLAFIIRFSIAEETLKLMTELTEQGELAHLTAERVWMETEKALNEPHPEIYFETLHQVGALKSSLP